MSPVFERGYRSIRGGQIESKRKIGGNLFLCAEKKFQNRSGISTRTVELSADRPLSPDVPGRSTR